MRMKTSHGSHQCIQSFGLFVLWFSISGSNLVFGPLDVLLDMIAQGSSKGRQYFASKKISMQRKKTLPFSCRVKTTRSRGPRLREIFRMTEHALWWRMP